jgi:RNA polymerase sigma factor (sigma-70 family)
VTTKPLALVVQHLRRSALLRDGAAQTDGELLEAFLRDRDGLALEALVRRHAPLVWGVCRRTLPHHDAEDAFQATFLVLVRKAASLRSRALLPNWLYRVACQTARKARQTAAKRCSREKQLRVLPEPSMEPLDDTFGAELRAVLDEELSRLPEKYRLAVVLCDVECITRLDAARQLGLPQGTVASRLARGRALLARRLLRRGLSVSATALAAWLPQAASGAVPAALLTHTSKTVSLLAAGKAVPAGLFSPEVGPLAEGVLHALAVAKQKTAGVGLVLAALVLAGGVAACHTLAAFVPDGGTATAPAPVASSLALHAQGKKTPPKHYTNSLGMKFVWIPPGRFMMGSPKEEKDRSDNETQHKVTLTRGFYMGVHPVTQEQWQEVVGNNPSTFQGEKNLPVNSVSWNACQEFIKKLREKDNDKKAYRLPTEAEWEYACRAGTTTPFHFGETISTEQANYCGDEVYRNGKKGGYREKTTPVGAFPANGWGLHDMHGNVLQWCQDWLGDYPKNDATDPQGPENGSSRVLRGGCWGDDPQSCRSASRCGDGPGCRDSSGLFGFRVCFCLD